MLQKDAEDSTRSKRMRGRACDACRAKKVRCDGGEMPNSKCSTCIQQGKECNYQENARRRAAPKWYVEKMEDRTERMEQWVKNLHPEIDLEVIFGRSMPRGSWEYALPHHFLDQTSSLVTLPPGEQFHSPSALGTSPVSGEIVEEDGQKADGDSTADIERMLLKLELADGRHYGPSSNSTFIQTVIGSRPGHGTEQWIGWVKKLYTMRRKNLWDLPPWEKRSLGMRPPIQYSFPPTDLIPTLIERYFWHGNLFCPVLHKPTFLAHYSNGLHKHDSDFAALLMFVCAVGSRWCDDPRVWEGNETASAGWKYFEQAWPSLLPSQEPVSLTKLQCYCVAVLFMSGGGTPQFIWMLVGLALHLCQDVGAHLSGTFKGRSLIDQELYRRVFWTLFSLDASFSSAMGRLTIFAGRDFDVERPLEVDDEYWLNDDPELAWRQPPGKPSLISFFNQSLNLIIILVESRRALFPLSRNMPRQPNGPESEQDVLAAMDSAMNRWLELLPDHLRWNPQAETTPFFIQSATLHLYLHQCTILVHREFIPSPARTSSPSLPSLAICTNSARSTSRILGVLRKRGMESGLAWVGTSAFHAAVIILLNIWGKGGKGSGIGYASQIQDVHDCIWTLTNLERRWPVAGKLRDVLEQLASVGDFPLPDASPVQPSLKRTRSSQASRGAHDDDTSGMPVGKALRTLSSTSPLSLIQSSSASASIASPPTMVNLGQLGLLPDEQTQLDLPPMAPEQCGDGMSVYLPPTGGSSASDAGGPEWGSSPSLNISPDVFGLLGHRLDASVVQPDGMDELGGGFVAPDVLDPMALDTLMQLWSHTPMGTGWELWDNLPTMPSMAEDSGGNDPLDAIAGGTGGIFRSGFDVNGDGA